MSVKNQLSKLLQEESAKAFLEALLGSSIKGVKRISQGEDMSEVFASCGVYPDLYIEDLSGNRYVIMGLEKDEEKLREFYQHGYDQMKANFEALQEFLKEE